MPRPALQPNGELENKTFKLINTAYLETEEGREILKYLIDCALPNHITVSAEHNNEPFVFHGGAGLAPDWLDRSLNTSEQRWVSACMLARVNYYGEKVKISMRGKAQNNEVLPDILQTTEEEVKAFPLFEGGFYGNLFLEMPEAYACIAKNNFENLAKTKAAKRVCSHASENLSAAGDTLTWCGFIHTGECNSLTKDKVYPETIYVYLQ